MSQNNDIYTKKLEGRIPEKDSVATVTIMNNRIVVKVIERRISRIGDIKKVSKYKSVNSRTGEVYEYTPNSQDNNVRKHMNKAFRRLEELIDNNFGGGDNELHIVLTDGTEGMDINTFNKEFGKFRKKLKYHYPDTDCIAIREMTRKRKWHMHVLVKADASRKLIISNSEVQRWWRFGWTKTLRIKENDNLAGYFTVFRKEVKDCQEPVFPISSKMAYKREMLKYFPSGKKLYTTTAGIIEPEKRDIPCGNLEQILTGCTPYYKSTIGVMLDDGKEVLLNAIHYLEYRGRFSKDVLVSLIDEQS